MACAGVYPAGYIGARDAFNAEWIARVQGNSRLPWQYRGSNPGSDPQLAATSDLSVIIAFRDPTGGVWAWPAAGIIRFTNGALAESSAAAGGDRVLQIAGRDAAGGRWWYRDSPKQWTFIGNSGISPGAFAAAPKLPVSLSPLIPESLTTPFTST